MQKSLDQMNVQIHHAVTEVTGKTGMSIIRAIVDGERGPKKLAMHRDKRCKKTLGEIAEHLIGNWRSDQLFNLKMGLQFYDQIHEMIKAYETELMHKINALQPPDRANEVLPAHPNPMKEKVINLRGDQEMRQTLWRFSGVDLTRIDGVNSDVAQMGTYRSRSKSRCVSIREKFHFLASSFSKTQNLGWKTAQEQEEQHGSYSCIRGTSNGRSVTEILRFGDGRLLSKNLQTQGRICHDIRHRKKARNHHFPNAPLRPRLCRHR
jgi:hypothetical protein